MGVKLRVEDLLYLSYRRTQNSLRLLSEYVTGTVLDIGSGRGHNLIRISDFGSSHVVGSDLFIDQKELQSNRGRSDISFVQSDCISLPFKDGSIDLAFAHHVIEHIVRANIALRELFRVLKKNGKVIICVPTISSKSLYLYWPAGHLALMFSRMLGNAGNGLINPIIEGRDRPSLVLGSKAKQSINALEGILRKTRPPFLVKLLYSWAATLYFAIQNHTEHRHKMLNYEWKRIFKKNGFRVKKTFLCGIFPHWLSNFLPRNSYPIMDRIEDRLNEMSFLQNYVSQDMFYVLVK